jgi:hypothetical protein
MDEVPSDLGPCRRVDKAPRVDWGLPQKLARWASTLFTTVFTFEGKAMDTQEAPPTKLDRPGGTDTYAVPPTRTTWRVLPAKKGIGTLAGRVRLAVAASAPKSIWPAIESDQVDCVVDDTEIV